MKGPLAIEKSNFLIEPIDTPFSSGISTDHCCCSEADTGENECRVMTQPHFPCASAALNSSIYKLYKGKLYKGRTKKGTMRKDGNEMKKEK